MTIRVTRKAKDQPSETHKPGAESKRRMETVEHCAPRRIPPAVRTVAKRKVRKSPKSSSSARLHDVDLRPTAIVSALLPDTSIIDAVNDERDYVHVKQKKRSVWLAQSDLSYDGGAGFRILKESGILAFGRPQQAELVNLVQAVEVFRPRTVMTQPGWRRGHYALQDGTVFSPPGQEAPVVAFNIVGNRVSAHGSRIGWRHLIDRIFTGHPIAELMLCAAFVPPVLDLVSASDNILLGLCGASSTGKSRTLLAAASVYGPASNRLGHYRRTLHGTVNGLEQLMPPHRDGLLVLDELGFLDHSADRKAAASVFDFVLRLSLGDPKFRSGDPLGSGVSTKFVAMVSANKMPKETLNSLARSQIEAVGVRLFMARLPERTSGLFEGTPRGFNSVPEALRELESGLEQHHGVAIRRFVQQLVNHRASNQEELESGIRSRMAAFKADAVDLIRTGQDDRIVEAISLISAVGQLAQRYKVLPRGFDPVTAGRRFLELLDHPISLPDHVRRPRKAAEAGPMVTRLVQWLECHPYYDIRDGRLPRLSNSDMEDNGVFLWSGIRNRTEILLSEQRFRAIYQDYVNVLRTEEAKHVLLCQKGRMMNQRSVRRGHGKEWLYCIEVPSSLAPPKD